jgi:hypothetical protein
MTITNYIPTFDNDLFQNYDNRYIIYFQYDNRIYVLRSNNRLTNNNNRNNTTTTTTTTTTRPVNIRLDSNSIINYDTNRNDTITNDYIRNY